MSEGESKSDKKAVSLNEDFIVPFKLPQQIVFFRGDQFRSATDNASGLYETTVISAINTQTIKYFYDFNLAPETANLLTIKVDEQGFTTPEIIIKIPAGEKKIPLGSSSDGYREAEKQVLFVYGDTSVSGDVSFENVEIIDISDSSPIGFLTEVEIATDIGQRKIGIIDFLIKATDDKGGNYRSARYGIFKTRTPSLKIIAPHVLYDYLEVFIDDGDDTTPDKVNITCLLNIRDNVTDISQFPVAVAETDSKIGGEWETDARRCRLYKEEIPPEGNLALFIYGENRVYIKDKNNDRIIYTAHFLLYIDDKETVPGPLQGIDKKTIENIDYEIAKNHILLDFKADCSHGDISSFIYSQNLRPQGFSGNYNILQAAPFTDKSPDELDSLIQQIKDHDNAILEDASFDFLLTRNNNPGFCMENLPLAFNNDFNIHTGDFNQALNCYFHHFYMHTFPAHRLIDKIRLPDTEPVCFRLSGAHFNFDKTFILPSGHDEIVRIIEFRKNHAARKIAIFGHTDAVGSEDYNNKLASQRGQALYSVFVQDIDWWSTRLDGSHHNGEQSWGTLEIEHILKALGYFSGNPNGWYGANTRQAVKDFQQSEGYPQHPRGELDEPGRRKLILRYMEYLTDSSPLGVGDFFQDGSGAAAVFACGEAYLLIKTNHSNPQNRRVECILREEAPLPVDLTRVGGDVPYREWLSQETDPEEERKRREPSFTVACYDSEFGNTDNYSGDDIDSYNRLMIKGRRLVSPTLVAPGAAINVNVYTDGDVSHLASPPDAHGTGVMTCMAGDGIGNNPGTATDVVLGTGKDIKLRPMRSDNPFLHLLRAMEVITADQEVRVVSTSLLFANITVGTPAQIAAARNAMKDLIESGKIFFLAACNVHPFYPMQRDVQRTQGGNLAPDRNTPRAAIPAADAFRQRIVTVGATSHVTNPGDPEVPTSFTYLGDELSIAAPGHDIRMVYPQAGGAGVTIANHSGTSFSTPITAGIAAEMMLVNDALQDPAHHVELIEMLEATADPVPSLADVPAADQGQYLPGAANADPQLVPGDMAGFRRVHFWKAILAAVNNGIPTETTLPGGAPANTLFTTVQYRDHANTNWYGFEIRTRVQEASIWFETNDGSLIMLQDVGASMPDDRITGETWRKTQPLRVLPAHATVGYRGFPLPAFPFAAADFWMYQFSIKKALLADFSEIRIYASEVDPLVPYAVDIPPLCVLDLAQIVRMRNPAAITGLERTASSTLDQIATHVEAFDDFVFHITLEPLPVQRFRLVHPEGALVNQEFDVQIFAIDKFGNMKTDFNGNVDIKHTGTNGNNGPPAQGVFINGNPAGAATSIAVSNGIASFKVRDCTIENFYLHATNGIQNDDNLAPEINVGAPGDLAKIQVDVSHWNGDTIQSRIPRTGDRLRYTVTALDGEDRVITNFRQTIELIVVEGEMGYDVPGGAAPYKMGIHVADTANSRFNAGKFKHTFTVANKGKYDFSIFVYTTGPVVLEAGCGDVSEQSRQIEIKGGPLDHFLLEYQRAVTAGNSFHIALTAKDKYDNTIDDFEGDVSFSLVAGTAAAPGPPRAGVFFANTAGVGDDHYTFDHTDQGVYNFPVTAYTAEKIKIRAHFAGISSDTEDIDVQGAAALHHFDIVVHASQAHGVQYPVTVKAMDADNNLITDFTGNVNLQLAAGTPYNPAGPAGTQIVNSPHAFVANDHGSFTFEAVSHTAEAIQFSAVSGAVLSNSVNITIR